MLAGTVQQGQYCAQELVLQVSSSPAPMGLPLDWHRAPALSSAVGNDSQVVGNLQRANGTNGFLSPSQRSMSATDLTVQVSLGWISGKAFYVAKYVLGLWMSCMLQKSLVHASQICVA